MSNIPRRTVLIVDQYSHLSPYYLQQNPIQFTDLCTAVLRDGTPGCFIEPIVSDVPEDIRPGIGTMLIAAKPDGHAFVWKYKYDSSG